VAESVGLHESVENPSAQPIDRQRAILSIPEEPEAADRSDQAVEDTGDAELAERSALSGVAR
jgi:hypothetical protein